MRPCFESEMSPGRIAVKKTLWNQWASGGGGGNRTRVRMVSDDRVYVRRLRSLSVRPVAKSGGTGPSLTYLSPPATVRQRSGSSAF